MIERIILMCAGRAERWGNYRGVRKHLVPVRGEALLDRMLRLIRGQTDAPVVIMAFGEAYDRPGCERLEPRHGPVDFTDADKFLSSEERWGERGQTILLYGDVYFTESAMKTILGYRGEQQFFGRREGSYFTGCPWRELFALSFAPGAREGLRAAMLQQKADQAAGKIDRGGGWELYERLHGTTGRAFTVIDDFTDDFDYPHDYDRWMRRYGNPVHRLLVPLYGPAIKSWKWRMHRWGRRLLGSLQH